MRQSNSFHGSRAAHSRRGAALIMVALLVSSLAAAALVMMTTIGASKREKQASKQEIGATFVAEAGMNAALLDLVTGGTGQVATEQNASFGGAEFAVIPADIGGGLTSLTATGNDGNSTATIEVVVQLVNSSLFAYGAFGDEGLTMDSNAFIDSYDSSLGDYASQEVNGQGNDTWANENGHAGSNNDITLESNSGIHGNATPGPSSSTTLVGNNTSVSGSTAPAANTMPLDPLTIPSFPSSGSLAVSGTEVIPSGNHHFDALVVKGTATLQINGPATVVFGSAELRSNAELLVDATNGPVEIYVIDDFILNSNTLMASTTKNPGDLALLLESDNIINPGLTVDLDDVLFESNAKFYGTIYAPNAAIDIDSNFELFGAIVARQLHLDSNSKIHFDEALLNSSSQSQTSLDVLYSRVVK